MQEVPNNEDMIAFTTWFADRVCSAWQMTEADFITKYAVRNRLPMTEADAWQEAENSALFFGSASPATDAEYREFFRERESQESVEQVVSY